MNYPVMTGALPYQARDAMGNPVGAAGYRGRHLGLVRNSPAFPQPSTGALPTMDEVKAWMEKTGPLNVQNKWWAAGGAALALAGLYLVGKKNYWFGEGPG